MRAKAVILLAALVLLAGGCAKSPAPPQDNALVLLDGQALSGDEVKMALCLAIENVEAYGSYVIDWEGSIDEVPSRQYIRDEALDLLAEFHAVASNAERLGCELTDGDQAEIDSMISQEADFMGGEERYREVISGQYGSLETYRRFAHEIPLLYEKLMNSLYYEGGMYALSQADVEAYYRDTYVNCAYILLSALDDEGFPLEDGALETMRSVAEALRKQAEEGEDFLGLVAQHGQDYIMSAFPDGYPIAKGLHGEAFDGELEALEVGEISPVVYSDDAFYVIKRLPDNDAYFDENYDAILSDCVFSRFQARIEEWKSALDLTATEAFHALDPEQYAPGVG